MSGKIRQEEYTCMIRLLNQSEVLLSIHGISGQGMLDDDSCGLQFLLKINIYFGGYIPSVAFDYQRKANKKRFEPLVYGKCEKALSSLPLGKVALNDLKVIWEEIKVNKDDDLYEMWDVIFKVVQLFSVNSTRCFQTIRYLFEKGTKTIKRPQKRNYISLN